MTFLLNDGMALKIINISAASSGKAFETLSFTIKEHEQVIESASN